MNVHMYHFTRDGAYDDGCLLTEQQAMSNELMRKYANTYEGCHAWVFAKVWYHMPAAGLSFARWEQANDSDVPMCVRMAEIVRGE